MEEPDDTEAHPTAPSRGWTALLVLLALVCVWFAVRGWFKATRPIGSDFTIYWDTGRALLEGRDPYTVAGNLYPPSFAVLVLPFSLAPYPVAVALWQVASLLAIAGCVWLSATLCATRGERPHPALLAVPLLVALRVVDSHLAYGQVNAFTLFMCLAGVHAARRGLEGRSGAWIALGAATKVLPAILVLPALLRRRGKVLAGFAVAIVLLSATPIPFLGVGGELQALRSWRTQVIEPRVSAPTERDTSPAPGQSLKAAVHRLLTDTPATSQPGEDARANVASLSPETAEWIVRALNALILAVVVATLLRRPAPADGPLGAREAALLLLTPLLVAPEIHRAHTIWMLPALAFATSSVGRWRRGAGGRVRLALVALGALCVGGSTPALVGRGSATVLLTQNVIFLGVFALWLALVLEAWARATDGRAAPSPATNG
ncbi:MAG: glycosyltransferase family 87 protein [Planctomycetota bacterium]